MKESDWVTDGARVGLLVASPDGKQVFWLGGDISPASESLRAVSSEEAERALTAANERCNGGS